VGVAMVVVAVVVVAVEDGVQGQGAPKTGVVSGVPQLITEATHCVAASSSTYWEYFF